MVDVVVNHNGWNGSPDDVDFSAFRPFNQVSDYNVPYCKVNYDDQENLVSFPVLQDLWLTMMNPLSGIDADPDQDAIDHLLGWRPPGVITRPQNNQ